MAINYTSLLGLAKPVTGTEAGQWGEVINDQITSLLESAVAGAVTLDVTSGNVTLTTTTGAANQARAAILLVTGTPGTSRNIVAPSSSKVYVVVNGSDAAVVVKGSATTGVTIATGDKAIVAWDGSDFVAIASANVGDVDGPASSTNNNIALFDGVTGKLLKDAGKGVPTGTIVGTSDSQTLTNKTISVDDNTLSGIAASSFVLSNASGNIDGAAAQKAIPSGVVVGTTDTQTLTNKTISGANNTISNVSLASQVTGTLPVANGGTAATDAGTARSNLGLGSIATQAASSVSITGGTITGITDLTVSDGGTGRSTLTAENVLLGDGTNAVKFVAPGTNGNVLTSNGTTWTSAAPASGYVGPNKEVFTANGTFTIPTGITKVKVTVVGGGGGGANGSSGCTNVGGGGGGGGGAAIKWLSGLTPGNTLTVTRGAGGAAQASGNTSSVASGTQSITTISATGGSGTSGVAGAAGGSGSNGDLNIGGQGGTTGSASSQETGAGGSSILGGGGRGSYATANGVAGSSYGGGGSGGQGGTGGAGANGVIIFEW